LVYVVYLIAGFLGWRGAPNEYYYYGRHLVIMVLLAIVGVAVFGGAYHTLVH
jgi:hypothetical protein